MFSDDEARLPPKVQRRKNRHGNYKLVFVGDGGARTLPDDPASDDFKRAYFALTNGTAAQPAARPGRKAKPQPYRCRPDETLRWLVDQYLATDTFRDLDDANGIVREKYLDQFCDLPRGTTTWGMMPFAGLRARHMDDQRRAWKDAGMGAAAITERFKAIRVVFNWAIRKEIEVRVDGARRPQPMTYSPMHDFDFPAAPGTGKHRWTDDDIRAFAARWPIGSKQWLAYALMAFTGGIRKSDAALLGPQHVTPCGDFIVIREYKNGHSKVSGKRAPKPKPARRVPLHPALKAAIAAQTVVGTTAFLINRYGVPYTIRGLGSAMREWCNEAGLPKCSSHGIRRAAISLMAEAKQTGFVMKAVSGHTDEKMLRPYTEEVVVQPLVEAGIAALGRKLAAITARPAKAKAS